MAVQTAQKRSADLATAGKALRESLPLASHGQWQAQPGRDPLSILQASDAERVPALVPIRYGRMLPSPFTFYRGAAAVMAADLAQTPKTGLIVQACGDCHLNNFGGFETTEGQLIFDINDFDETLPAPWEWDVKRLATSFVLAIRDSRFGKQVERDAALACVRSYREAIRAFSALDPLTLWYTRFGVTELVKLAPTKRDRMRSELLIEKATQASGSAQEYPKLAATVNGMVHIRDAPPLIFHPEEEKQEDFLTLTAAVLREYHTTLEDDRRVLLEKYGYLDAAIKVVGVGSVGTQCWVALMMTADQDPLFLQFKQAIASVLEPYAGKSEYANHGERVVAGQRLMQAASDIFLGWTSSSDADFYVRQLRDAKISPAVDTFDAPMFEVFARCCGWTLARAHAKTGDSSAIRGYLGKSDKFDEAVADFAKLYADQTERDHDALKAAVEAGRIKAEKE
jgi:uncharacterized protein (DUF2252 family)